jgi:hypothetical protein
MDRTADPRLFQRIGRQLAAADIEAEPSEVHGVLCGLLCAGRPDALDRWLDELFAGVVSGDLLVQECKDALRKLYRDTLADIDDPGLGFSLLIPDEHHSVRERTAAVRGWCDGFLYGLGIAGIARDRDLSAETREALNDFSEITRVDVDQVTDSEADQESLIELTEFLWVAAMLIREELAPV